MALDQNGPQQPGGAPGRTDPLRTMLSINQSYTGDQADESTTVTVSNIGKAGMRIGIPAIVAPAVATLAIGEAFPHPVPDGDSFKFKTMVTATLSFDHRIANGVGAANFMNDVKSKIEAFSI